jgi:putative transposase
MHSLKRYTSRQANLILGREGQFWQHESYDHVVRDEQEFERIMLYILNNPLKASLVDSWEKWEWSYFKYM